MSNTSTYDPPFTVEIFHNAPRFRNSDNLAAVATGQESWQGYAQGTIFIGCFILYVFFMWMIFLISFACCGQNRVGILSGKRLQRKNENCMHKIYRSLVIGSCVFSLLAGVMFLVKVTTSLGSTFDSARDGINSVSTIAEEVTNITVKVIIAGEETVPIRDDAVNLLNQGICSTFTGGNGNKIDFDTQARSVVDKLTALSDFTRGDLTDLKNSFSTKFDEAESEVNRVVDEAQNYARASYYAITIIVLSIFLSMGGYMAWFGPKIRTYFFFQSWIFLPLYTLVLILTAVVVGALGAVLIVNSDACLGGEFGNPESFIKSILDVQNLSEYPKQVVDFYILNKCEGSFIGYESVDQLVNDLIDGRQAVIDLGIVLGERQRQFEVQCGGEPGSLDPLVSSLTTVEVAFSSFIDAGIDTRNLLECQPIHALYTDFFHDGVCRNLPNTLFWMFMTMLLVVIFGLIILTFRGALVPTLENDEPEDYYYSKASERKLMRQQSSREEPDNSDDDEEEDSRRPQADPTNGRSSPKTGE